VSTLHRIGNHPPAPHADVVFVHGLGGDAFRTWAHRRMDPDDAVQLRLASALIRTNVKQEAVRG